MAARAVSGLRRRQWRAVLARTGTADTIERTGHVVTHPFPSDSGEPVANGQYLVYRCKLIEGRMTGGGGSTALFIDRIGVARQQ